MFAFYYHPTKFQLSPTHSILNIYNHPFAFNFPTLVYYTQSSHNFHSSSSVVDFLKKGKFIIKHTEVAEWVRADLIIGAIHLRSILRNDDDVHDYDDDEDVMNPNENEEGWGKSEGLWRYYICFMLMMIEEWNKGGLTMHPSLLHILLIHHLSHHHHHHHIHTIQKFIST